MLNLASASFGAVGCCLTERLATCTEACRCI
jgi:hypothetical protein